MKTLNLTGQKFGKLLILSRCENSKSNHSQWVCVCDCGNIIKAIGKQIKSGYKKSCGCMILERNSKAHKTHGMSKTSEFTSWLSMKSRCYKKSDINYHNYGGRGIIVCEKWKNSFEDFYKDMGNKPDKNYTLDRIDVNKNYCPENCRWATKLEQAKNKQNTKFINIYSKTLSVSEWSIISGIKRSVIISRLRYGWEPKLAIFAPLNYKR